MLPSLFEEQLTHDQLEVDRMLETAADHTGEAIDYFPELDDYNTGPDLPGPDQPGQARAVGAGDRQPQRRHPRGLGALRAPLADAGADALELNLYTVATDPSCRAAELEAATWTGR